MAGVTSQRVATTDPAEWLSLRDLRILRGYSLRDVEQITKIDRATISRVERGIMTPRPTQLVALGAAYDIWPGDLMLFVEWRIPREKIQGGATT